MATGGSEGDSSASTRGPAQQAGVLVFGNVLATLSDAVVPLLVVRLIGKADVATLLALLLVYNTVALLITTGFPQTLMYHLPGRPIAERRAVTVRIVTIMVALGAVAGLLLAGLGLAGDRVSGALAPPGSGEQASLAPLVVLAFLPLFDLPARLLPNLMVAEGRARTAAWLGVFKSVGMTLATVLPLALGYDVWTVAGCIVAFGVAQGALVLFFVSALYRGAPRERASVSHRTLFQFALPLGMTEAVAILNARLDKYLVLLFFPAVVFAEYQAGAWQIPFITTIPYAVGTAFAPRFVELFREGRSQEAIDMWRRSIDKVSLLVIPATAVFVVGAEEVVEILFTRDFIAAVPVFRLYAILTIGRVAAYGTVIVAAGRPGYVFQASVLSLLGNVALSVPLLYLVGFVGPALGTVLAFVPTATFYVWSISRASKVPFTRVFPFVRWLKIVGVAAVPAAFAFAFKHWVGGPVAILLAVEAAIVLFGFAALGGLLGLIEREDWRYAWSWVRLRAFR